MRAQKPDLFELLQLTQNLNKIKKSGIPFVDIGEWKFQQKVFNPTAVGGLQSFKFFRQSTWVLENHGVLSNFLYEILNYLILNQCQQIIKN